MENKDIQDFIRDRIAECKDDPDTLRHLESVQEKIELHEKAMAGDIEALMKCSLASGMLTQEQYQDFIEIRKEYGD